MKKKTIVLFATIISLTIISVLIYGTGKPDYGSDFSSCHGTPSDISIGITGSDEISANTSSNVNFTITAMGANIFVQLTPGIFDNDLFVILPTKEEITDNSIFDLDSNPNAIEVDFNITTPATDGYYTLFIMVAEESFDGDNLAYVSVNIIVGETSEPPPTTGTTPKALFLANYNYYLGGFTLLFLVIGTIFFQINLSRKKQSKVHVIFMASAFIITTVNIFLIFNDSMDFIIKPSELTTEQSIDLLIHILLGSVGYITGIIVVFGTFSNVPDSKMKLGVYVMLFAWVLNFFFEIFMPTGG